MSQSPILSVATLMPRSSEMPVLALPVCPPTVKQTVVEHPLAGPALVSPDITASTKDSPALKSIRSLPTHANRTKDQQVSVPVSGTFGANEGPLSPEIKLLVPRSGKWTWIAFVIHSLDLPARRSSPF